MAASPLSLASGLVLGFLVIHAAVAVDTSHRAEKSHAATTRVMGIDAKGVLSYADTPRVSATSGSEVADAVAESASEVRDADHEAEVTDAVAESESEVRDEDREEAEQSSEPQVADAVAGGEDSPSLQREKDEEAQPQSPAAEPTSGKPKGMMRREVKQRPAQAAEQSDPIAESPSSLLQVESRPSQECMTEAKSGGGNGDGNFASFKLNGNMINPAVGRGFNVIVVNEDWTEQETFRSFDTCGSRGENADMADFLFGLGDGACIVVAIKDDATMKITSQSKLALENYGATEAFNIGFRQGYVLMGCKGQPKIKEVLVGRGDVTPWVCPERCEWGEWSEWGEGEDNECPVTCGGGEERRTREKTQEGETGGWPCEGEPHETRECAEEDCIESTTTNITTTSVAPLMPILKAGADRLRISSAVVLAMAAVAVSASWRL